MGSGNLLFTVLVAVLALVLAAIFVMIGVVIIKSVKNAKNQPLKNKQNGNQEERPKHPK